MSPSEDSPAPTPRKHSRPVEIATYFFLIAYMLSGLAVQLFVPHYTEIFQDLEGITLPTMTTMVLGHHLALLALTVAIPAVALVLACRSGFRLPLPKSSIVLVVLTTVLGGLTAFALLQPLSGVMENAGKIRPVQSVGKP